MNIDETFGFRPRKDFFYDVVQDMARQNPFHPVRDYLDGLQHDGVKRVDNWLSTYMGVKTTPETAEYINAVGLLMLVAAARRIRQPGCKFDELPILGSKQGKDKSSALAILAVREEWFSDDMPLNLDLQTTVERLAGKWIIEIAELKGLKNSEVEHVKAFLSRRVDRTRPAYGRLPRDYPRQCVFFGTSNNSDYLRDDTGNRRMWPIVSGDPDLDALRRDRDQLWAEAAALEADGVSIRMDKSLWETAAKEQEKRRVIDPWETQIGEVLGDIEGKILVEDAWNIIGVPIDRRTQDHYRRLGSAMRKAGFDHVQAKFGRGRPEWCYRKGPAEGARRVMIGYKNGRPMAYLEDDKPKGVSDDPPF